MQISLLEEKQSENFPSIYIKESQNFDFYQNRINSPE